jgi:hypothetical protein
MTNEIRTYGTIVNLDNHRATNARGMTVRWDDGGERFLRVAELIGADPVLGGRVVKINYQDTGHTFFHSAR